MISTMLKNAIALRLYSFWCRRSKSFIFFFIFFQLVSFCGIACGFDAAGNSDRQKSISSTESVDVMVGAVLVLALLAAGTLAVTNRLKIPFAVALVLVGFAVAQLAPYGPDVLRQFAGYRFSPEVFLFVFLPTLIFESAFNMDTRQLRDDLLPIFTLAIPGLLLSTAIIGILLSLLTPIELPAALLLGAILSIIDHVRRWRPVETGRRAKAFNYPYGGGKSVQ